jgi:hypothetical protein
MGAEPSSAVVDLAGGSGAACAETVIKAARPASVVFVARIPASSGTILLNIALECFIQPEREGRRRYRELPAKDQSDRAAKTMKDAEIEDYL